MRSSVQSKPLLVFGLEFFPALALLPLIVVVGEIDLSSSPTTPFPFTTGEVALWFGLGEEARGEFEFEGEGSVAKGKVLEEAKV